MIGEERISATREQIYREIGEEFGSPRAWSEAQGLDYDEVLAWARADYAQHLALTDSPLPPPAAMVIGIQIGLRLGRAGVEA